MNSNELASTHIAQPTAAPDAPLARDTFANSPWPIALGIAAALCVIFAVNAWDKAHAK